MEARIERIEAQLARYAREDASVQTLLAVRGIGLLTATALVAAVGTPRNFKNGRHLAAWLGLTPKESSSGMRRCLGRISKRGDAYLRTLITHGARAVLSRARQVAERGKPLSPLQSWALSLEWSSAPATTRPPAAITRQLFPETDRLLIAAGQRPTGRCRFDVVQFIQANPDH